MRSPALLLFATFTAVGLSPAAHAQKAATPRRPVKTAVQKAVKAPAPSQTTRVVMGALVLLDVGKHQVRISPEKSGAEEVIALYDRDTRFTKEDGSVRPEDFKPHEPVVARLSVPPGASGAGGGFLRSLSSRAAYDAEQQAHRDICIGTVVRNDATLLEVERSDDKEHVSFRVSPKTRFIKDESPVPPLAYPIGAAVAVKPRALPGGGIMAQVVAESGNRAFEAYKDSLTVWEGYVESVDVPQKTLTLRRSDGVSRTVIVPSASLVSGGRRAYTFATLPVSTPLKVHLVRSEVPGKGGLRTADGITILTRLPKSATLGKISDSEKDTH